MANKHTLQELMQWQALPLSIKVAMTKDRIRNWIREYGEDGVYVSFSGGKDSTVLLHIVREAMGYTKVPAVFVDTGLEYPEIRNFVKTFDNVEILRPKLTFKQVIEKYGYPFFSKETSEAIYEARKYFTNAEYEVEPLTDRQTDRQTVEGYWAAADFLGVPRRKKNKDSEDYQKLKKGIIPNKYKYGKPVRILQLEGKLPHTEHGVTTDEYSKRYDKSRYLFMLEAPFQVNNACCKVMKKAPVKEYAKRTHRHPMTAQMASESRLRQSSWIKNGCNSFDSKNPISNPMAFWTEQDILLYIKQNNIPICSVYGDIVEDRSGTDEVEGQLTISDLKEWEGIKDYDAKSLPLKTTGCNRTGCMFCGYGCHLEKEGEGRFELMKKTHPKQYEYIMKPREEGGLNYRAIIDWINENGNMNIRY